MCVYTCVCGSADSPARASHICPWLGSGPRCRVARMGRRGAGQGSRPPEPALLTHTETRSAPRPEGPPTPALSIPGTHPSPWQVVTCLRHARAQAVGAPRAGTPKDSTPQAPT